MKAWALWDGMNRKKIWILGGLATVFLLAGLGLLVRTVGRKDEPPVVKRTYQEASDSAALASNLGNYDEAKKILGDQVKSSRAAEEKYNSLIQLAVVYINQKDYQGALEQYRLAEKIKGHEPGIECIYGIAFVSDELNDKRTAIDYYRKSIALLDQKDPRYQLTKSSYESKIKALGG